MKDFNPNKFLVDLFQSALGAANPRLAVPKFLKNIPTPRGRTIVIGAGKAAAAMAKAVEENWPSPLEGLVVTRYGHNLKLDERCQQIEVVEAAHPLPDKAGQAVATRIYQKVHNLTADDLLICLISGGGSSLLSLPVAGITLADKQRLNASLLRCGASIAEINIVRKHLSAIKGGQLAAAAYPARVVSLLVSDVAGDDPATIASGPTVADPSTFADARVVLRKYKITPPSVIAEYLKHGRETPKPGDSCFVNCSLHLVAKPQNSLLAAAELSKKSNITPVILGDSLEGEAHEMAKVMAGISRQVINYGQPNPSPCVLISGGEATVTLHGQGRGGRNTEFLLALAVELNSLARVHAIACDTDGIDGSENNAGAIITPDTLQRASKLNIDAKAKLSDNDSYGFFQALDDLIITGPTLTNVNDFRAILILPK